MIESMLEWCLDPAHAGTIIACTVAFAFVRLAFGESNRSLYRR